MYIQIRKGSQVHQCAQDIYKEHLKQALQKEHKKHSSPQQDPTHSTKSNKGIESSLMYMLTQEERLQRNKIFNHWSFCSLSSKAL